MTEREIKPRPTRAGFFDAALRLGFLPEESYFPTESYLAGNRPDNPMGGAAAVLYRGIRTRLGKPDQSPPRAVNFFDAMIGAETASQTANEQGDKAKASIYANEALDYATAVLTAPAEQMLEVMNRIDLMSLTSPRGKPLDPDGLEIAYTTLADAAEGIAEVDAEGE